MSQDIQHLMRPGTLSLSSLPPLSLYVHLPWCLKKCPYCDFNSHEHARAGLPEARYLQALRCDLESALPLVWGRRVGTVFIGGGTPSLFSPEGIERLLADVRARGRAIGLQPDGREAAIAVEVGDLLGALADGADVRYGHSVTGLLREGDRVRGVQVEGPDGPGEITADLVVACDGLMSRVRQMAGIRADFASISRKLAACALWKADHHCIGASRLQFCEIGRAHV